MARSDDQHITVTGSPRQDPDLHLLALALVAIAAERTAAERRNPWRRTDVVDGEIIAPGFRLYSPDSEMGGWVITGTLPREGPWRMFNHYDLQGKLVAEGLLKPEHCDSELGMFCVYPPDEATARLVGAWLNERLSEGERKLLSDPDRLARVDAALADPDAAVPWTPRTQAPGGHDLP